MSMKNRFKKFFELDDDVVEEVEEVTEWPESQEEQKVKAQTGEQDKKNVVSLQSVQQSAKVMLVEPRTYDEAQDIADQLKNRKAVIINLQRIGRDQALRIVDFLSGTVYAIGGDITKIGQNIFLCVPDNVNVTGQITEMMQEGHEF
ncbi:cell division protein SepF [Salsuginibacillus kocurii]|uniref:cell division protein SepF n=1 Tax=Salsuginibacillus kocurii TaxID=427078 RepID=UPI000372022C|nr:cell division protein SepF [Salsuginibacillus kocurii]